MTMQNGSGTQLQRRKKNIGMTLDAFFTMRISHLESSTIHYLKAVQTCAFNKKIMQVSSLTFNMAWQIGSDRFLLKQFCKYAEPGQFIYFTHTPFFYSYPDFGKAWPDGKVCQFHQVVTSCHICGQVPERNYGGYGTLLLQRTATGKRMDLLCDEHITGLQFNEQLFSKSQLSLF